MNNTSNSHENSNAVKQTTISTKKVLFPKSLAAMNKVLAKATFMDKGIVRKSN